MNTLVTDRPKTKKPPVNTMHFVDPKNDVAFKKTFGDENHPEILIEFLNAVLELPEPILSVEILNAAQPPLIKDLKGTILDIRARDSHREFLIEMQVESEPDFAKRIFHYTSKAYCSQIGAGEDYSRIKPIVFLGVLNFHFFNSPGPIKRHMVMDRHTHEQKFGEFDLNFIELPKFNKTESELTNLTDEWLFLLKNASKLQEMPKSVHTLGLSSAYSVLEQHRWTRDELALYEYWKNKEWIHLHALNESAEKAREAGKAEKAHDIACALIREGLADEKIAKITGLTPDTIHMLRNALAPREGFEPPTK